MKPLKNIPKVATIVAPDAIAIKDWNWELKNNNNNKTFNIQPLNKKKKLKKNLRKKLRLKSKNGKNIYVWRGVIAPDPNPIYFIHD